MKGLIVTILAGIAAGVAIGALLTSDKEVKAN